jgi:(p)ppGpp synthase/HD superfamily hydrolase
MININGVNIADHDDHTTSIFLTLELKTMAQLTRLMSKIERVQGVINVSRKGLKASSAGIGEK